MSLFLSFAAALFTSLALNKAKSFIPFGPSNANLKRWPPEEEEAVSERRKACATAYRSDKDRQA